MHLLILLLLCGPLSAAPQTAYDIAKMVSEANEGFIGEQGDMQMILISGDTRITRKMVSKSLDMGDEDRTLLEFVIPKDVAGTKLLTWSYDQKDDQQWIYLPALRRVKRITSSGKTASFMGSEFTFEDLRKPSLDKYTYSGLKTDSKNGKWLYERKSKDKSGYSKQEIVISQKYMSVLAVKFYDRSEQLLKTAKYENFKEYSVGKKKFWRPGMITMANVQTNKSSIISWENRKVGVKANPNNFTKQALK